MSIGGRVLSAWLHKPERQSVHKVTVGTQLGHSWVKTGKRGAQKHQVLNKITKKQALMSNRGKYTPNPCKDCTTVNLHRVLSGVLHGKESNISLWKTVLFFFLTHYTEMIDSEQEKKRQARLKQSVVNDCSNKGQNKQLYVLFPDE